MLADHREQHATPICESFPLVLLLSLSQALVYQPYFVL